MACTEPAFRGMELIETLDWYDGPILHIAQNEQGQKFVAWWADETDSSRIWLYAPISEERLQMYKANKISTHDVFAKVEGGYLYRWVEPVSGAWTDCNIHCERVRVEEIDPECFPAQDKEV